MPPLTRYLFPQAGLWFRRMRAWTGWETTRVLHQLRTTRGQNRWELVRRLHALPVRGKHVRELIALLDDEDAFFRWEVEALLSTVGAQRAFIPCLERVKQKGPVEGLASCIRVLAAWGNPKALDAIISHQHHPSVHVRVAVADALVSFVSHLQAQDALLHLLDDPEPAVRRAAVWALRRSEAPWAEPVLTIKAKERPEPWCRQSEVPYSAST